MTNNATDIAPGMLRKNITIQARKKYVYSENTVVIRCPERVACLVHRSTVVACSTDSAQTLGPSLLGCGM